MPKNWRIRFLVNGINVKSNYSSLSKKHQAIGTLADPTEHIESNVWSEKNGAWFPSVFIGLYFLLSWAPWVPEVIANSIQRWYVELGLAVFTFIILKTKMEIRATRIYLVVYGLSFFGALLSLSRARDFDLSLWNTVAFGTGFLAYLFFIPTFATKLARHIFLIMLMAVGIAWAFRIQLLAGQYSVLYYSSFGVTGSDKNQVGLYMSLTGTALFYW